MIDDFMKAGGTARGMAELAEEVGAKVVGKAFFIATQEPEKKMIDDYTALFVLKDIDTENMQLIGYEGSSYTLYEDDGIHKDYDKKENYRVLTK